MPQSRIVRDFIEKVCEQVKAQRSHGIISNELLTHIEDQKIKYMNEEFMSEYAAEERAVDEMGDPVTVGEQFNKIHRSKYNMVELTGKIVMWSIAGGLTLFSIIFGIGIAWSMLASHPQDYIAAFLVFFGIAFFGTFIAFAFVSICKAIGTVLFYSGLVKDYKKRKKRGELYGQYKHN